MFGSVSRSIKIMLTQFQVRNRKDLMLTKGIIKSLSRRVFEQLVYKPFHCRSTLFISPSTMVVTVILLFVLQNS